MTVMEQTENENGWKSLKVIREIKDDKMIAVSTCMSSRYISEVLAGGCFSLIVLP